MDSTLFTIGTALNRARDHGLPVRLLVGGHWIEGAVSAVDGHGVVLTGSGNGHHVVRMNDISVVHVSEPEEQREAPREWAPEPPRRHEHEPREDGVLGQALMRLNVPG